MTNEEFHDALYRERCRREKIESENALLREQVEAMKKDAERYGYLRSCAFDDRLMRKLAEINEEPETPEEFDTTIDAALEEAS